MSKIIETKLPLNLNAEEAKVFIYRKKYVMPELKTRTLKNVFLTHGGILLKNLFPVKRSLPNALGFKKPNAGFIFQFYRKAIEILLVSRYGKSLKSIKLNENKNYLFVFTPWFGYFSWITESLPRIFEVENKLINYTLIVPESYSKKTFVIDSLKMFPNLSIEIIPEGIHMEIPKLTMPELKPFTYTFEPNTMKDYRQKVWEYVDALTIDINTFEKIYVSRKMANNRKLVNEQEVLTIFNKYDYKEICFEDYTFFEQVFLMKNCKVLAGVHGAGFANISFMPKDSILFEMIKEYSSYKEERPSYWRLCSSINVDYYIQYCKPVKYGNYDLWIGVDLICNTLDLQTNLNLIEDNKGKYNIL